MKLHLVILSVASVAFLVSPALGTAYHASALSSLLKKGALLKGLSLAGAKSVLSGDMFLASKGLAAKNLLGTHVFIRPVIEKQPTQRVIVLRPPQMDSIIQRLFNFHKTELVKPVVHTEEKIIIPTFYYEQPKVVIPSVKVQEHHEVPSEPEHSIISQPYFGKHTLVDSGVYHHEPELVVSAESAPKAPSVAIVGPTMNVIQHPHNNAYSG